MSISEYKGKISVRERGWSLLPGDLLQYIASLSLILANTSYVHPSTQSLPWQSRTVLFAVRDAAEMERLMCVCLGWKSALEAHHFWQFAVSAIDPLDTLIHHANVQPPPLPSHNSSAKVAPPKRTRLLPHQHFRNLIRCSCTVCRVGNPHNSTGLASARQPHYYGPLLGVSGICPAHADTRPFCSICFRDSGVSPSNDYESFPGNPNVCKTCRKNVRNWHDLVIDEECKRVVEWFVTYGEGTARRAAEFCLDRTWLRRRTQLLYFTDLVRANNDVFKNSRPYDSDDEIMDDSDDEEDEESFNHTGRSMALVEWARERILAGFWILPTDQWLAPVQPIVLARSQPFQFVEPPSVLDMDPPPSYQLCECADGSFRNQLAPLLRPAFDNILRKLIMQGGGAKDAERLTIRDLGRLFHEQSTWWDGSNWTRDHSDDGSDDSAPSTTSASSTSPVLSTSTLQTTPSPPPMKDDPPEALPPQLRSRAPFVAAARSDPRPVRTVPWVPDRLEDLPEGSQKAIMTLWRMACEPMYQCECPLCERVKPKEKEKEVAVVPSQQDQLVDAYALEELDGEGEVEYEDDDELYSSDASVGDYPRKRSADVFDTPTTPPKRRRALSPEPEPETTTVPSLSPGRKRSSEEVEQLEQFENPKRLKRAVDVL